MAQRDELIASLEATLGPKAAANLPLEILPQKSLQVLSDLFVPDEKAGHVERCRELYTKFTEQLVEVGRKDGQEAMAAFWNEHWPAVDDKLCAIIEPVTFPALREELEAYYTSYVEAMQKELGPEAESDEKGPPLVDDVAGVGP